MPKCVYCGKDYEFPRGLTLIGKDGGINYLCSAKCRKNMAMKRRKVRWILKDKKDKKVSEPVKEEIKAEAEEKEKGKPKEEPEEKKG